MLFEILNTPEKNRDPYLADELKMLKSEIHKKNDFAVMEVYDFDKNFSDEEILTELMKLYKNLTEK